MILLYAKREPLSAPSSSLGKDAVSLGAYSLKVVFPQKSLLYFSKFFS